MNKRKNKIKEKIILISIIVSVIMFLAVLFVPFIVNKFAPDVVSEITADGILAYMIEALSVAVSLVLSCVAVWQTKKSNEMAKEANRISKEAIKMERDRYKLEIRPFFTIVDWKIFEMNEYELVFNPETVNVQIGESDFNNKRVLGITFELKNTTHSDITIEFKDGYSCDNSVVWQNCLSNQPNRKIYINPGEKGKIIFYANSELVKEYEAKIFTLEFYLENRFAERYLETVNVLFHVISSECLHKENEWFCSISTQEYNIGKFISKSNIEWEIEG